MLQEIVFVATLVTCQQFPHSPNIITDRHPNPLFSVCIISPNAERKIMQTNCVRKTGAVFFGSREIIRGNLTRAKSL